MIPLYKYTYKRIKGFKLALFLSSFIGNVDAKGRVSVPAQFRSALSGKLPQQIALYRSFTSEAIEGCNIERMEQMADATDNLDTFSEEQDNLTSLIFADARQLNIDGTGRITLPEDIREHAGITNRVTFVGRGKTFQIWNPEKFEKTQEEARKKALANRPTLKINTES